MDHLFFQGVIGDADAVRADLWERTYKQQQKAVNIHRHATLAQ